MECEINKEGIFSDGIRFANLQMENKKTKKKKKEKKKRGTYLM